MAAKYPGMVRSVVTIGCGGEADPAGADDFEPEALLKGKNEAFIEMIKALHGSAHGGDWQEHCRQSAGDWRNYPRLTQEDWHRITMPMLAIGGEKDIFASREKLLELQRRCPQAELLIVPGGSHRPHMPMEQCIEVNQRILGFLKTA